MKICTKCKIEKDESEFNKNKQSNDGLQKWCKTCKKQYREANRQAEKQSQKQWREANREHRKQYEKQYYQDNKKTIKQKHKRWCEANREHERQSQKRWREANREYVKQSMKQWREENKEQKKQYEKQYVSQRKATDPLFKLRKDMSSLICTSFKNKSFTKSSKTAELLGCTYEEFYEHLDYTCLLNYGYTINEMKDMGFALHKDHIIPCAIAETKEELIQLQHYSNFQILTSEDNLIKSDSEDYETVYAMELNL